jgi:NAD(P) transhydrogenase subunit alpha
MVELLNYFWNYKDVIFIIILSALLGIEVIAHVPSVLHTPLMSGSNAISGVSIIGGIILLGHVDLSVISLNLILGILAVFFGTLNVAGGFVVTDRMLEMFKKKKKEKK